jgi:hypothetical protein
MISFQGWPKIPRLASPFIITEKIDGTNAAVLIEPESPVGEHLHPARLAEVVQDGESFHVFAQSRTRFITPESDNFGFAAWVKANAQNLVKILGPGRHFGEWWGHGIQRGYGLPRGERRFSLFNVTRYNPFEKFSSLRSAQSAVETLCPALPTLGLVPVLSWGTFDMSLDFQAACVRDELARLSSQGSLAVNAPIFNKPEGVVLFHTRSGQTFKAYCDESEKHA